MSFVSLWCLLSSVLHSACCCAMPRQKGCTDYSEAIKQEICATVRHRAEPLWRLKYETASAAERSRMFKRGRGGDPLLRQSYDAFKATILPTAALKEEQKRIDEPKFNALVKCWLPRYRGSLDELRCRRTRKQPLTAAEDREAATILATPRRKDGSVHYYRSVHDAIDQSPRGHRLQTLLLRSKLKEETFRQRLLENCKHILKWKPLDLRDALPAATLEGRRRAADVWGGRIPWLTLVHRKARLFDETLDDVNIQDKDKRYIYWSDHGWDIFWYFTFIVDATTVDNTRGQSKHRTMGFVPVDVVYPPEDVPAAAPATNSNHVMFYCIIHPHIGLASGPWIMHAGSSKTNTKRNSQKRHVDTFPTWCVRACHFPAKKWTGQRCLLGRARISVTLQHMTRCTCVIAKQQQWQCRYKVLRESKPVQLQLTELEYNCKLGDPDNHLVRSSLHISKALALNIMAAQRAAVLQVATVHTTSCTQAAHHLATRTAQSPVATDANHSCATEVNQYHFAVPLHPSHCPAYAWNPVPLRSDRVHQFHTDAPHAA
jgi:hypothetical protein